MQFSDLNGKVERNVLECLEDAYSTSGDTQEYRSAVALLRQLVHTNNYLMTQIGDDREGYSLTYLDRKTGRPVQRFSFLYPK